MKRKGAGVFVAGAFVTVVMSASLASADQAASQLKLTAASLGVKGAAPAPAVQSVPASPKSDDGAPAPSRWLSGSASVSGQAFSFPSCATSPTPSIPIPISAHLSLTGTVNLSNSGGVHGTASLFGTLDLSGTCFGAGNNGMLYGVARVQGSGPVYDSTGKFLGNDMVSGEGMVNVYALSDYVSVNQLVQITGSF